MTDDANRREFLRTASATVAVAGVAGCLNLGGGAGTDTPEDMDDDMTDDGMSDDMTDDGMAEDMETDDGMSEMTDTDGMSDDMTDNGMGDDMTDTDGGMMTSETLEVTITTVSETGTLMTMGEEHAVPLSPVAYAVHSGDAEPFAPGEEASGGLESLAEDGMPGGLVEEWRDLDGVSHAGAVATPDDADGAGPLSPGESYTFEVEASPHDHLTVATMFVQSNDLFYAPGADGIGLFEDDQPTSGDVTDELVLWDAGTERNEEPGVGEHQAPRQSEPDSGEEEMAGVREIDEVDDGYDYPDVSDVIEVTVHGAM